MIIYGAQQGLRDDRLAHRRGAGAAGHLAKAMAALQSHTTTGANHPAQWAAATAFSDERVDAGRRQDGGRLPPPARPAGRAVPGRGARRGVRRAARRVLLLLPGRRHSRRDRRRSKFCEQLMQREGVALVPGAAFGDDRWVRLSYAVSDKELEAAVDRIIRFIRTTGSCPCRLRASLGPPLHRRAPGSTRFPRSRGDGIPRPTSCPAPSGVRGECPARRHHRADRRRGRDRGAGRGRRGSRRPRRGGLARGRHRRVASHSPRAWRVAGSSLRGPRADRTTSVEIEAVLTIRTNPGESIYHLKLGTLPAARAVRVADQLLVELDAEDGLGGLLAHGRAAVPEPG